MRTSRIVEGPQLKGTDVTGLSDLSVQMQKCALTLAQMGYKADVNGSDNLIKVMKRLPVHLQSKWADRAGSLTQAGVEPNFWHLAEFVGKHYVRKSGRFHTRQGSKYEVI